MLVLCKIVFLVFALFQISIYGYFISNYRTGVLKDNFYTSICIIFNISNELFNSSITKSSRNKSFKENSKPKNVANILFIHKSMNQLLKDVKADLNNKGYYVTISLLKKYDKFFRANNIQSVKEIR